MSTYDKIYKVCLIGAAATFILTVTLHFFGIPFYITGHLVLPWFIAMLANRSLNRPKK